MRILQGNNSLKNAYHQEVLQWSAQSSPYAPYVSLWISLGLCPLASWRKRLAARLPPLGSRVRVSVTPCGFRGGRNEVWVGFSRCFSRFSLQQISVHHFSTLISPISFHFVRPCDGATGVVGRHPCYSLTYNIGASSHLIPRPDLVLDTSWGYLFIFMPFSPQKSHYSGLLFTCWRQ